MDMPRTIAVVNPKGGSGKTTTAVNLACCLAEAGQPTLLVDMCAQPDATWWCGVGDGGAGLAEVLTQGRDLLEIACPGIKTGMDLVPSSAWLIGAEQKLVQTPGAELVLRERLGALPADRWTYIVIDCPPGWGRLTVVAMAAAQEIIIPVEAHVLGLTSLARLFELVEMVQRQHNAELRIAGVLACRVDARSPHSLDAVELLRAHVGPLAFETVIREHASLAEAPSFNHAIIDYDERSTGTEDFRALADELPAKLGSTPSSELFFELTQK